MTKPVEMLTDQQEKVDLRKSADDQRKRELDQAFKRRPKKRALKS